MVVSEPVLDDKLTHLRRILLDLDRVLVAFSGGVDSAFLLKMAVDTLGKEKVVAATAISEIFPPEDLDGAMSIARDIGVRHIVLKSGEMENRQFIANTPDRCYICKKGRFDELVKRRENLDLAYIIEGSNRDDEGDYRPGEKVLKELGIRSPLREAGLYKSEIRELSRKMGLPAWNRPSSACMATRVPYGTAITSDKLKKAHEAEVALHCFGFTQLRVRNHGDIARIEVPEAEIDSVIKYRADIVDKLKKIGFTYVTLDLEGFRSGSMNEVLKGE